MMYRLCLAGEARRPTVHPASFLAGYGSDRSSGAGDLICAIERLRLLLLLLLAVVGDAGRAAIFISITPCRASAAP